MLVNYWYFQRVESDGQWTSWQHSLEDIYHAQYINTIYCPIPSGHHNCECSQYRNVLHSHLEWPNTLSSVYNTVRLPHEVNSSTILHSDNTFYKVLTNFTYISLAWLNPLPRKALAIRPCGEEGLAMHDARLVIYTFCVSVDEVVPLLAARTTSEQTYSLTGQTLNLFFLTRLRDTNRHWL